MHSARLSVVAVLLSSATAFLSPSAGPHPRGTAAQVLTITNVVFTGNPTTPTVTVSGSGFGASPPRSFSAAGACNGPRDNGRWYGKRGLWIYDNTNRWGAGHGDRSGGDCVGIRLRSWSASKAVFGFGAAYNTHHWFLDALDTYRLTLRGKHFDGRVTYQDSRGRSDVLSDRS